ncbi:MAG: cupin domain-containing protein [Sneathiella sp.]|nr:cupin domain-containing protein [Sneathiella sp.]
MTADEIIEKLGMKPHPEGGYYVETYRDTHNCKDGTRAHSTAIYYLLKAGDYSHWHRVDVAEAWHFYAGSPLELSISDENELAEKITLGPDILMGERPQVIVKPGEWQSARPLGNWTLVGCTVAPGFEFSGFEMALRNWVPSNWPPKV